MQTAERKDEKQIKRLYVRILGIGEYRTRIIRMEYDGNVDFWMFAGKKELLLLLFFFYLSGAEMNT